MKVKRGQVTLFGILSVVLLIIVGSYFLMSSEQLSQSGGNDLSTTQNLDANTRSVMRFAASCLDQVSEKSVVKVGLNGGYDSIDDINHLDFFPYSTAYYFYLGEKLVPTKGRVEVEISNAVNSELFSCLNNFDQFRELGIVVGFTFEGVKTTIGRESISISLNSPLTVIQNGGSVSIPDVQVQVNYPLGRMLDSANMLAEEHYLEPDYLCIHCVLREASKNKFDIQIKDANEGSVVFVMMDNLTGFELVYAYKYPMYSCNNPPPNADVLFFRDCLAQQVAGLGYAFTVEEVPNLEGSVGVPFSYQVQAEGRNLRFKDSSPLFEINPRTGLIEFVPSPSQVGGHTVWIHVEDEFGNERDESFKLVITL
jgi:hypothetical protein